jgi:conjugal transfer pilus assembly protein TraA
MCRLHRLLCREQAWLRSAGRVLILTAALVALRAATAQAGTDQTFTDLNDMVVSWTQGSLGKAFALIALILGIGVAAARQSFGALFGGIGVAAAASIGPTVIDQVVTALF